MSDLFDDEPFGPIPPRQREPVAPARPSRAMTPPPEPPKQPARPAEPLVRTADNVPAWLRRYSPQTIGDWIRREGIFQ
jgi:hypothetical protein